MTQRLNRILMVAACAVIASLSAANAAQCLDNQALTYYLGLGSTGCTIGDKIFSDFTYTSSAQGATQVLASGITVNTLGPAGTGAGTVGQDFPNDIGLQFNASWIASGVNTFTDSIIGFTVTVVNGANMLIHDAGLAQLAGASGTGTASVVEKGCGPVPCQLNQWGVMTLDSATTFNSVNGTIFAPVGSVRVQKDISVNSGTSGFAHLSKVSDTFSQIPEPRAMSILLSLGLLGGLFLRKKLQGVQS